MSLSLEGALLVAALCLDTLAACFALGTQGIQIPTSSSWVVSLVCSGVLGVSLLAGALVRPWFTPGLARGLSFVILLALGVSRLLDGLVKDWIRRSQGGPADLRFHFLSFNFLLRVYADNAEADQDHSKLLAPGEAAALALALSADGLAAGFGAGIGGGGIGGILVFCVAVNLVAAAVGSSLGRRVARTRLSLSWLAGAVLLVLAAGKLA